MTKPLSLRSSLPPLFAALVVVASQGLHAQTSAPAPTQQVPHAQPVEQAAPAASTASAPRVVPAASAPASAASAVTPPASAASEPQPVQIDVNDPAIRASIRKARATLNGFLRVAAKDDPNNQAVSLKVAIREGKKVEHLWVTPFKAEGKRFTGTVNDKPEVLTQVKQGDKWTFGRQDVVDWMYYDTAGGQMHGNFSTCAKLSKGPKEDAAEMKRIYGLDCGR